MSFRCSGCGRVPEAAGATVAGIAGHPVKALNREQPRVGMTQCLKKHLQHFGSADTDSRRSASTKAGHSDVSSAAAWRTRQIGHRGSGFRANSTQHRDRRPSDNARSDQRAALRVVPHATVIAGLAILQSCCTAAVRTSTDSSASLAERPAAVRVRSFTIASTAASRSSGQRLSNPLREFFLGGLLTRARAKYLRGFTA